MLRDKYVICLGGVSVSLEWHTHSCIGVLV